MGIVITFNDADFSAFAIGETELPIEWHGWLGDERLNGEKIGHQITFNSAITKVYVWSKNQRDTASVSGKHRRSFGIVDVSGYAGATVKIQYTKNKSSSEYYAGFASDINKETLSAALNTSATTNTNAVNINSGITPMSGQAWNNTTDESVDLFELCDTVEKVIPTGAKYLLFDYTVENDDDTFEGFVKV